MQNLYLRTPSIPLPRPLLAHYPRKTEDDFDKHIGYGFVQGVRHTGTSHTSAFNKGPLAPQNLIAVSHFVFWADQHHSTWPLTSPCS